MCIVNSMLLWATPVLFFNLNADSDPLLERKGESRHSLQEQCSRVFQVPGCTKWEKGLTMCGCPVGDARGGEGECGRRGAGFLPVHNKPWRVTLASLFLWRFPPYKWEQGRFAESQGPWPQLPATGCCLQLSLVRLFCFVLRAGVFFWQRAWHPLRVSGTTLTEGRESVGLGSWGFIEFALKSYRVVLAKEAFLMNPPDWWSHVFAKNKRGRSTEWSGFLFNLEVLLSSTLTCPMFSPCQLLVLTSH